MCVCTVYWFRYYQFEIQSRYYVHFQNNSLGKVMGPHISPPLSLIVSPRMGLVLNNPRMLIGHNTKKQNYTHMCTFTNPTARAGYKDQFFKQRFEIRVFLLLDRLPNRGLRAQSSLIFYPSLGGDIWIHTIREGNKAM